MAIYGFDDEALTHMELSCAAPKDWPDDPERWAQEISHSSFLEKAHGFWLKISTQWSSGEFF